MHRERFAVIMFLSSTAFGMDIEKQIPLPGASYFVIHTEDGSTVCRVSRQILYTAPYFYKILIKDSKDQSDWHASLPSSGPLVSFHDQDTYLIEDGIKRDAKPFEKIALWEAMLDPCAKVFAYKAIVYTMQHTIKIYDKRNHFITDIEIRYDENMRDSDFRDVISAYVDHSRLEKFTYNTDTKDIMYAEDIIQSYRPTYNQASLESSGVYAQSQSKCVMM